MTAQHGRDSAGTYGAHVNEWEWLREQKLFAMDPDWGGSDQMFLGVGVNGSVKTGPPLIDCQGEAMAPPAAHNFPAGRTPSVGANTWGTAAYFGNTLTGSGAGFAYGWNYSTGGLLDPIGGTQHDQYTIAIVAGRDAGVDTRFRVMFWMSNSAAGDFLFDISHNTVRWLRTFNAINFTYVNTTDDYAHRFVFTWDGTNRRTYHNGVFKSAKTGATPWGPGLVVCGGLNKMQDSFQGTINAIICDRAWDADQVAHWSADPYGHFYPFREKNPTIIAPVEGPGLLADLFLGPAVMADLDLTHAVTSHLSVEPAVAADLGLEPAVTSDLEAGAAVTADLGTAEED